MQNESRVLWKKDITRIYIAEITHLRSDKVFTMLDEPNAGLIQKDEENSKKVKHLLILSKKTEFIKSCK